MAEAVGLMFEKVVKSSCSDDGAVVAVTLADKNNKAANVFIPTKLVARVITLLHQAANAAGEKLVARFGSRAAADAALGVSALSVEQYDVRPGARSPGDPFQVLVQVRLQGGATFDLNMEPDIADQLGESLKQCAAAVPGLATPKPN